MSGRRQHRVEELLRRELAQMLLRGELRDPRLAPASAISPPARASARTASAGPRTEVRCLPNWITNSADNPVRVATCATRRAR